MSERGEGSGAGGPSVSRSSVCAHGRGRRRLRVLFLCTGNSCRSQMAEGWARQLRSELVEAYSAGVEPRGIDPLTVAVMGEAGVDISSQRSKDVLELMDVSFDYVVTLCGSACETCPVFPGEVKCLYAGFDDPSALAREARESSSDVETLVIYRQVRDEIRAFVETLPEGLDEPASSTG